MKLVLVMLIIISTNIAPVSAQESPMATLTAGVNMRENPSINAAKLQSLAYSSQFPVLGKSPSGYWYQLDVSGTKGWVCRLYATVNVPAASLPVTSNIDENCTGRALKQPVSKSTVTPPPPLNPGVHILSVPVMRQQGNLKGRVVGFDNANYKVACFLYVGSGWWTKPYWSRPDVYFDNNGNFSCDVTTGGIDHLATRFLVFVLPINFNLRDKLSYGGGIHSEILSRALASATYDRPS